MIYFSVITMKLLALVFIASAYYSVMALTMPRNESSPMIADNSSSHDLLDAVNQTMGFWAPSLQPGDEDDGEIHPDRLYTTPQQSGCHPPPAGECEKQRKEEEERLKNCQPPDSKMCKEERKKSKKKLRDICDPRCRPCVHNAKKCEKCKYTCYAFLIFYKLCLGTVCYKGVNPKAPCCYIPTIPYRHTP
ncbi:hypothetical protein F5Y08DRAFT_211395 [Xylaria arbuscula]|nr:hypothetical protein F5Y08DRAFT_211395 [Xylaria arbuscula]